MEWGCKNGDDRISLFTFQKNVKNGRSLEIYFGLASYLKGFPSIFRDIGGNDFLY